MTRRSRSLLRTRRSVAELPSAPKQSVAELPSAPEQSVAELPDAFDRQEGGGEGEEREFVASGSVAELL